MRYWLVMPAAGSGQRFGGAIPKQYLPLAGRPLIEWSLAPFLEDSRCAGACVALAADDGYFRNPDFSTGRRPLLTTGGATRADSVSAALDRLEAGADDWVLVHDAARPCVSREEVDALLAALAGETSGALLALPVSDTLKSSTPEGEAGGTVPREGLWRALTPQAFRVGLLRNALQAARRAGRIPTDEAQAIEWSGGRVRLVRGSSLNIKVTEPDDLRLAEAILCLREGKR